jgi:anaerobic selenocysteine-containing dehydrogenase
MGGAFWEFGAPDWDRTEAVHAVRRGRRPRFQPDQDGLGKLKERGVKVIGVNPVRTGYNAIADEWVGITPGTDGLFILALIHELLRTGKIDLDYLIRYTNAPWLVIDDPDGAGHGLVRARRRGRAAGGRPDDRQGGPRQRRA